MSGRPATEPRTEVPRCRYVCGLSERVHEDARTNHPFMPPLAGAAPRAEGLALERLRIAVMEGTDPDTGDVWLHREDADILRARLSHPSDEVKP